MKRSFKLLIALWLAATAQEASVVLAAAGSPDASGGTGSVAATSGGAKSAPYVKLTPRKLEELAGPIALYPDPLLGMILPASVFPDQIVDAALLIKSKSDAGLIAEQDWDPSVKGIATYPGVLKMMYEKIDWTTKLGEAFLNQSPELRDAIQSLRVQAQRVGNLRTTEEQKVTTGTANGETVIKIEPATTEVVYVPQYTTQVYTQPAPADTNYLVPLATFGIGMAMGAAMADDDDDDIHVYGGYPGSVAWYDHNSVDHWVDNRQDMIRDSQEHRQSMSKNRMDYRQDTKSSRQDFRQDQIESGNYPSKESRDQFRQEQSAKRQDYASSTQKNRESLQNNREAYRGSLSSASQSQEYQARKQQAQQRSQEWKSSAADRGYSGASRSSESRQASRDSITPGSYGSRSSDASRGSAFGGYSSRSSASAYGSRGSSSRSAGGYSGGGYSGRSGSGYSGGSRSGGMSRGGGGMSRGGGGGRRR